VSYGAGTMPVDIALLGTLLSLGLGLGTLGTVLLLRARVSRLEAENKYLRELLEERGSRLKLVEDRLAALEAENRELRERLAALEDIAVSREPSEQQETNNKQGEIERDLLDLKILALYKQGHSIREIAKIVGLSKSTVHRRLKKLLAQ
jgi:transcriptional regulator of acetoin/glycerol metabolism